MTKTTDLFAETPNIGAENDVLSETLRALRITGSLLLHEQYTAPWAVTIPPSARLAALLRIPSDIQVAAFHLVEFGTCEVSLSNDTRIVLSTGEMAICFSGIEHRIGQGRNARAVPVEKLLTGQGAVSTRGGDTPSPSTSLLCGVFLLNDTLLNPLFSALPPLLRTSMGRPGEFHNLAGVARLMVQEINRASLGGSYIVERLLEVLCAEAIKAHIDSAPTSGWLRGIRDPIVNRALAAIHARPAAPWTVARLAASVAMSPSRFAARFSEAMNQSPMAYLTTWRMGLACRLLRKTHRSIQETAADVGYSNLAAFSRAFKKHIGLSPAAWRSESEARDSRAAATARRISAPSR